LLDGNRFQLINKGVGSMAINNEKNYYIPIPTINPALTSKARADDNNNNNNNNNKLYLHDYNKVLQHCKSHLKFNY